MAYSVNGKTYTSHPLMDEIVSCCKTIFGGIVIKNDVQANEYETAETIENAELFIEIKNGNARFDSFPFTASMLAEFKRNGMRVYSDSMILAILENRNAIPVNLRQETLDFCCDYFLANYEEKNNYYRSLAGKPPYPGTVINIRRERSDSLYNIYVYPYDFPPDYDTSHIDFSKPISELSTNDITVLQMNGFVDQLLEEYKGFPYSYLRYLGTKSIDYYTSRKADKWEILSMPKVEELVEDRFREIYAANREMYLKRTYQEAYKIVDQYYDESMIILLLCQTFADLVAEVPEWYIRRDIFDIRSVQFFLESYGVKFFDDIPLKYQIALVKNINKLIKYKSSTKNNIDILDIFNLEGTYIYKYYLYKKRINDSTSSTAPENYELEFIKYKEGESIDSYLNNNIYRYPYDDLTLEDKYWDGVYNTWDGSTEYKHELHQLVENNHKAKDFTLEGTKYMSIDYEVDMHRYQFQTQYFLSYILDSDIKNDIAIAIPSIDSNVKFNISDLFILLQLLTFSYDNIVSDIRRPEDTNPHIIHYIPDKYIYFDPLFRDDGDYDDYITWNYRVDTENSTVKEFDTKQFDFGDISYRTLDPRDDNEFNYEVPTPPRYDDYNETTQGVVDEGYDFLNIYFGDDTDTYDDNVYNFEDMAHYRPELGDWGYDFNEDPFDKEHWHPKKKRKMEVKTYIENQDPVATALGYNSFPVYLDPKDWIERDFPDALTTGYNKVFGFNSALNSFDIEKLIAEINTRSASFQFRHGYNGYSYRTIAEQGTGNILYYEIVYNFDDSDIYTYDEYLEYINPSGTIDDYLYWKENKTNDFMRDNPRGPLGIGGFRVVKSLTDVVSITEHFDINSECYHDLYDRIIQSDNRDQAVFMKYIFNTLFTKTFDYKRYQTTTGHNVDTLEEVIADRSYSLYNYYRTICSETNIETKRANIRAAMNDIITTLEYYISSDNTAYIFSAYSISSFSALLHYIHLVVGFFKSYKVYFLDPAVTYQIDDKMESGLALGSGIDQIRERKINYFKDDKSFSRDTLHRSSIVEFQDYAKERYKEIVDIYSYFDPDPLDDLDYDGAGPAEELSYEDLDGGVPDDSLNIPYKMINGGTTYEKFIDMYDLNGGTPVDSIHYLSLDGGKPYDPEELQYGPQNYLRSFNFIVDGGTPGTNVFYTKNMRTKVIDRQISQDVIVSAADGNILQINGDGLYVQDSWATWQEFNDVTFDANTTMNYFDYLANTLYVKLIQITDEQSFMNLINNDIDNQLYNIRKVSRFIPTIDTVVQDFANSLYPRLENDEEIINNFYPYIWGNF